MNRLPSIKTLRLRFGNKALTLRKILDGRFDVACFPEAQQWIAQCYNRPSYLELQLSAINETLDGYGVECIRADGCSDSEIVAEYINMGNTYASTVLYDHYNKDWEVGSWGDWYEWAERHDIVERESDV